MLPYLVVPLIFTRVPLIVIAIGDDYRFAFFGLVTKLWLKFQGLFFISLRIVDFTFLLQNWLNESPKNGNNNSGIN